MADPNFINGVNDIDIAIKSIDLTTSGVIIDSDSSGTPSNKVRKIVNLTIANSSTTTSGTWTINLIDGSTDEGTILSGELGPCQSVCLVDETRPMYITEGKRLEGTVNTANTISTYCASEVYT